MDFNFAYVCMLRETEGERERLNTDAIIEEIFYCSED